MKALFVAMLLLTSCGYEVTKGPIPQIGQAQVGNGPTTKNGEAAAAVTFSQIQSAILQPSCVRCHGPDGAGGVDVSTYEAMMDYVSAGSPDSSLLFTVIDSGQMPKRAPKLSDDKIQLLRSWILAGASKN